MCLPLILACSGSGSDSQADAPPVLATPIEVQPTPTPIPTVIPTVAIEPTSAPKPVATVNPTVAPSAVPTPYAPKPTPTAAPTATPAPTSTPAPTPTPEPTPTPTPTPTPAPTPTVVIPLTVVDSFGFELVLDGEIIIEKSGLETDNPNDKEGIVFFGYGGANSILLWLEDTGSDIKNFLSDSYKSLEESQPNATMSLIAEGETTVDTVSAEYLAFIVDSGSGDSQAGGVVGAWRCASGPVFSLTVTGADAALVQIRFNRILDGFKCSS